MCSEAGRGRYGRNGLEQRHSLITFCAVILKPVFHEFMNSRLFPRTRTSKLFHVTLHDRAVFAMSPRNCVPFALVRAKEAIMRLRCSIIDDRRTTRCFEVAGSSEGHRLLNRLVLLCVYIYIYTYTREDGDGIRKERRFYEFFIYIRVINYFSLIRPFLKSILYKTTSQLFFIEKISFS